MAEPFSARQLVILAKTESTYGTDASPTGGANAMLVQNAQLTPLEAETRQRQVVQPYFGARPSLLASQRVRLQFGIEFTGSGTAGNAPAFAPLLLACGLAETTVSGNATVQASPPTGVDTPTGTFTYTVSAAYTGKNFRLVTLTCTTPGGSGTAEFTVSAPAVGVGDAAESAYSQTGVVMTDATPFALPGSATITPTVGTSFDSGDVFTIQLGPPRAEYDPVSDRSAHDSCTIYCHWDGTLHAILGFRANVTLQADATQYPVLTFDGQGLLVDPAAQSLPSATLTGFQIPHIVGNTTTDLISVHGFEPVLSQFSWDLGNQIAFTDRVGRQAVRIGDRVGSGSALIEAPALADKNYFSIAQSRATGLIRFVHGAAAGRIVEVKHPTAELGAPSYQEDQNDVMLQLPYVPLPASGDDESQLLFY